MQYLEIKDNLKDFLIVSVGDILKVDPAFHKQRLSEWQKKGYIKKVVKGFYIFADLKINESVLFVIANKVFDPSYISLEMALSYYGLIPESVYGITSVTSRKSYKISSPIGRFNYRQIKPELMFGYQLSSYQNHNFKLAEIEKAILDYFYINSKLKTDGELEELRINQETFQEKVDIGKLRRYLTLFKNKALEKRINNFIKYITHA
jgi:predicted transcriptional regulator of viral defense system